MEIVSFPEAATPAELRVQVLALQDEAWPAAEPSTGLSHDPALRPLSMLLVDGGTVLAALDILRKELRHAGQVYQAGGLSTVVAGAAARGRGHGRRLVAAAHREMREQGLDLGLFTCDRPLRPFYESAGWRLLPGTVLIGGTPEKPFPSDRPGFDKVTMADFFSARAQHDAQAFEHARIGLYPGELDRLW